MVVTVLLRLFTMSCQTCEPCRSKLKNMPDYLCNRGLDWIRPKELPAQPSRRTNQLGSLVLGLAE